MLILWLTGLGMGIFYGIKMASEFKEDARFEQQTELPPYSTLYLKLNPNKPLSKDDSLRFNIDPDSFQGRILNDEDENDLGELTEFDLYIEKSEDNKTSSTKKFSARGKDFESALKAAQRTQYRFQQTDSTLTLDKYLYLTGNGIYRKQRVNVTLKVPLNTHLIIDGNLNEHLHRVNLWYCQPEDSSYKTPSEWIMTEEGLKCANDSLYQKKQNL